MVRKRTRQARYITNGTVLGTNQIQGYRLIAGNNMSRPYHGWTALRVRLPWDLKLTKYQCDPYSTTTDTRTLDELGYDFVVWDERAGKWTVQNQFKGRRPCDVSLQEARAALEKDKVVTS